MQDDSGPQYHKYGIHNVNLVKTVFANYGVVAQGNIDGPRGAWIHENNEYIGDISLLVGAEVTYDDDGTERTFTSVVTCPVSRTCDDCFEGSGNKFWGFQPVGGYAASSSEQVAMSTNISSWPDFWPNPWPNDNCGYGEWCGYFGNNTQLIQQESFYVMNDNNDLEFNNPLNNSHSFMPDPDNTSLKGLGLEVKVRGMQWQQLLAQDCLFLHYEIRNNSQTDYKKVVFGELVGTYIGGVPIEGEDDWSYFDVYEDIVYTGDCGSTCQVGEISQDNNAQWIGDVGMVAYAFLESPGNPYDGIDNDGDYIGSYPLFSENDFVGREISEENPYIIIIDDEYRRKKIHINEASQYMHHGNNIEVSLGDLVVEGNLINDPNLDQGLDSECEMYINPNAYDGIDNDHDGLIDENYYLHYKQKKYGYVLDPNNPNNQVCKEFFSKEDERAFINYLELNNNDDGYIDEILTDMIDEKRDDGIDNDGDWNSTLHDLDGNGIPSYNDSNFDQTDPDESDQIGLTSFDYFNPSWTFDLSDDEDQWARMTPGHFVIPQEAGDDDGRPENGVDGDFIFGSGYFPLKKGDVQRFSLALIYGNTVDDLKKNKNIVQDIYDNEYKFAPPPAKPTLTAVAGDSKVTLYWDRVAETTKDILTGEYDFQGYKIYKATDPNFNDVRNITNSFGNIEDYKPLIQFDLADDIDSLFYPSYDMLQQSGGLTFNLGDSSGIVHSFIDTDVINGRTYYYALTAYDSGNVDREIFPSENTKYISVLPSGEIVTDKNTVVVTPTVSSMNLSIPELVIDNIGNSYGGTGSISYEIIDPEKITGHNYIVEFWDSSMDGVDNDLDGMIDNNDLEELLYPITTYYDVLDQEIISVSFDISLYQSSEINLEYNNIIINGFDNIEDFKLYRNGLLLPYEDYSIELNEYGYGNGWISILNEDLLPGEFEAQFQYYPIFKSPYIQGARWNHDLINDDNYDGNILWIEENLDSEVFDGIRLTFNNDWNIEYTNNYQWNDESILLNVDLELAADVKIDDYVLSSYVSSNDLQITFYDNCLDCMDIDGHVTNFKISDLTRDIENLEYRYDGDINKIEDSDAIYIFENYDYNLFPSINEASSGSLDVSSNFYTWKIRFTNSDDYKFEYGEGDTLYISISKPFRDGDRFRIATELPSLNNSYDNFNLSDIRVVPNPYIATTALESALPSGISSGRGERKIEFQNVPNDAKIKIYNIRGQHIITLYHDGNMFDGSVSWNLRTKENIDIAYAVYLYVVESSLGIKKGKIAIIK